ncbi:MAG: flippase-like domain-containing protein [bacterium]|nr:flippase-like domain-containing protein [bacterium]
MVRRAFRIGMSLVLMVALVAAFLWNTDLREVGRSLESVNVGLILIAIGLCLLSYYFRILRWILILRPVATVRHTTAIMATAVGYTAMALLPARIGDLVRPLVLAKRDRLPVSATLASILTERIFDLWVVLLFFLAFLTWPPELGRLNEDADAALSLMSIIGYGLAVGLIGLTIILFGLFRYQERFIGWITSPIGRFSSRWQSAISTFLDHFLTGLKILQRPRDLLMTVAASLLLWLVIYFQVAVTLAAFEISVPFRATYLLVTLSVLGLAIPTPGGVGGFHKGLQAGLTLFFAVPIDLATGFAIASHAISFMPIAIIGMVCLPLLGLSFKDLTTMTPKTADSEESSP